MQRIDLSDAQPQLSDLVDAALRGETVLIAVDDRQAVQLVPVPLSRHSRRAGTAKGLVIMAEDFDAPLDDFNEYMA
jgi:antitoxin (DNA-binding transcriptional repressor) of toxin-antitoxin stability system